MAEAFRVSVLTTVALAVTAATVLIAFSIKTSFKRFYSYHV